MPLLTLRAPRFRSTRARGDSTTMMPFHALSLL